MWSSEEENKVPSKDYQLAEKGAKWRSTVRHMAGKHENHPDPLFPSCEHDEIEERKWIPIGN